MKNLSQNNYSLYQLKLPLQIEHIIDIDDPIYTFCEVVDHIDLYKYLAVKERKTGRRGYDQITLLKIVLFAFMTDGYMSLRKIEDLCRNDIRFIWLRQDMPVPSFMTISNFINNSLAAGIDEIFKEINAYIFEKEKVDTEHMYIDGTKITANANKYSWVWKKSSIKNRQKTFLKVTTLLEEINLTLVPFGIRFGSREEYAIEYLEELLSRYASLMCLSSDTAVYGRGHRKSVPQRLYDRLSEYTERLKKYAGHIRICGEHRNSYSKTDHDATFMRMKRDYMGNDQLLPGYNIQMGVCDEYIAVYDVQQYASDMDCFVPLMERFSRQYGKHPKYPIADAGYGSFNNYLYCEEHAMEKYMKFPMFSKETDDPKYRDNPFRAVNFERDENGTLVCPNGKKFNLLKRRPVKGNRYGREEELYQCEGCEGCSFREKCFKGNNDRIVTLNRELTDMHNEVLLNLNSTHGGLLRMNRSIQAEGVYGGIKWNRSYTRARRRGLERVMLEIAIISCAFNLHKFHLKKLARRKAA